MENHEEIERLLKQDEIYKKVIARGARNRVSRRRGIKGPVMTPVDFLSGKEKRGYTKPGEVTSYYMKPISWDEFLKLNKEHRIKTLETYLNRMDRGTVIKEMGTTKSAFNTQIHSLGLGGKYRTRKSDGEATHKMPEKKEEANQMNQLDISKFEGISSSHQIVGKCSGKELDLRLTGIQNMLMENGTYIVQLDIQEVNAKTKKNIPSQE